MKGKTKNLVLIVLVGCFVVIWRENTEQDVAIAQGRKAVVITRIFTGPDGLAHAEGISNRVDRLSHLEVSRRADWQRGWQRTGAEHPDDRKVIVRSSACDFGTQRRA